MAGARTRNTFRVHLILTSAIATSAFGVLVGASLFIPLAVQLDRPDIDPDMAGGIAAHFLYLHASFWPVFAGSLAASVLSAMLLFQRMTGPLVRMRRVFGRVAEGRVPMPITIRSYDYLSDETRALNGMLEALADRDAERAAGAARCEELVDELTSEPLGDRGRALVSELREALKVVR